MQILPDHEDHEVQMLPDHEDHDMQMLPDHEDQDDKTGEQRLKAAIQKESPTGLDMVLQKLMDPAIAPEPKNVPESLTHSKRPKKRKRIMKTNNHLNHSIMSLDNFLMT